MDIPCSGFLLLCSFLGWMDNPQVAALGPREYAKDNFNIFDGFIVISGLLELILSPPDILTGETGNTSGGALSALRSFRLFRVFKLAR